MAFSKLVKTITDELANSEEYTFLRDGPEFEKLIMQIDYATGKSPS